MNDSPTRFPAPAGPAPSAPAAPDSGRRRTVPLDPDEALRLLAGAPLGRIVFTRQALPAIRPVNHIVDDGHIIIRTHESGALVLSTKEAGTRGVVVAYEADDIDTTTRLGWSTVVTGYCHLVTDPDDLARYERLLTPWSDQTMDQVVRIRPDLVTGIRLVHVAETD
ncbi:pyridoxamine 5'-phosphate oxidase family protein [Streptomyces sp. NPDC048623]|uniref:pyridoxamine 5'-phosphate oxidase family protein n=1 Tax=Streptomyces sp. NPDC048623 TaxID=3155761 RepID=UPI003426EF8D